MSRYETGQQPCDKFEPHEIGHWGGFIVHQCPKCWGRRQHCVNCMKDHHEEGWETCKPDAYKEDRDND